MTRERPIIFSDEMVRAILDGRKSMTRRVVQGDIAERDGIPVLNGQPLLACPAVLGQCRYGRPGDRLWVRETFYHDREDLLTLYRADGGFDGDQCDAGYKWQPSIHMPRWASRILLEITEVRVEPLQEISEADAQAEGAPCVEVGGEDNVAPSEWSHRCGFMSLWDSIHGPGSWDANPWVWVIGFRKVTPDASP